MSYKLAVIGTGYVGLVSGTTFAATGNEVICVDIDAEKVNKMREGICPIYEPGLDRLLTTNLREGRLIFTTELTEAAVNSEIIFLCLPTPPSEDGSADLQHVLKVAADIASIYKEKNIKDKKIIVNKSTVPVGTAAKVKKIFDDVLVNHEINVVSNPEFLREGFAVEDAMKPERVVIGTTSKYAEEVMRDLYDPFVRSGNPIYIMDEKSAEVTKYAANAFLATKISFMNDLSKYCEACGADIEKVRFGIGSDTRIGKRFLFAGVGYGGSCFPKDVKALVYSADSAGTPLSIVKSAMQVNESQAEHFFNKILYRFDKDLEGRRFAIWGAAFKPNTDDIREAPAFKVIDNLIKANAKVIVYDPEALENVRAKYGSKIEYARDLYECAKGAEALIIITEWNVFRKPDFDKLDNLLSNKIIFDGRNLYDPAEMAELDYEYYCIGRPLFVKEQIKSV